MISFLLINIIRLANSEFRLKKGLATVPSACVMIVFYIFFICVHFMRCA